MVATTGGILGLFLVSTISVGGNESALYASTEIELNYNLPLIPEG
jgi:hypothetical protein